jgi:hypothetical protein
MSPILSLRHDLCRALAEIDEPVIRDRILSLIVECDMILYPAEKIA